jgi:exonuclease SbcD
MRLLHTSDWHLGQALHGFDRTYEHECFLDWLLDTIVAEQADVLLVAGDVFDNANPSAAAQKQLYRFLQQARQRAPRLDIVIIAGNHDSPGRIEAPAPLLQAHGTAVLGHVLRDADGEIDLARLIVPLTDKSGAVRAWCLAIPFLRPGDVPRAADPESPGDQYQNGIALIYQQAYALAQARCEPGQAIVAMGHCHMVDGQTSLESERRIVIGGTEALPATMFDPALAYAALGHLHLAQRVGQREQIRYSGSPLPLSFAEIGYKHQVVRFDLVDGVATGITALPVPRAIELLRIPPAPLEDILVSLAALELPDLPLDEQPLLEVWVLVAAHEPDRNARIRAALEGKPVRLATIKQKFEHNPQANGVQPMTLDQLEMLQPDDIFKRLYLQRNGSEAPADQLSAFAELMLPNAGETP